MAQTNYTPISLYYSTTASAVPTAANLVQGELAINTADGKLYYEDSSGVVQVLATKSTGSIGGSNTQVQFNNSGSLGGSSSFTWDGTTVTATKFAGALNGTVGATTASTGAFTTINASTSITNAGLTTNRVIYAGVSGLLIDSANLGFDGTTLSTVGITTTGNTILGNASSDTLNVGNGDLIKDSLGNLGLGVTPSAWGVSKAIQIGGRAAFYTYANTTTDVSNNSYIDGSNLIYLNTATATYYRQNSGQHQFYTAPSGTAGNPITFTQAMTLDASGGLQVLNTIGVGNTAPSTSGAGITFPATQNASSNANTLDDYEEGTWTAELRGSTARATTPVTTTGTYTKIGRLVTVYASFSNVDTTGATGALQVTGLPFTAVTSVATGSCVTSYQAGAPLVPQILGSGTTIEFSTSGSPANYPNITAASGIILWMTLTYIS